jgi:hypothetical protein
VLSSATREPAFKLSRAAWLIASWGEAFDAIGRTCPAAGHFRAVSSRGQPLATRVSGSMQEKSQDVSSLRG